MYVRPGNRSEITGILCYEKIYPHRINRAINSGGWIFTHNNFDEPDGGPEKKSEEQKALDEQTAEEVFGDMPAEEPDDAQDITPEQPPADEAEAAETPQQEPGDVAEAGDEAITEVAPQAEIPIEAVMDDLIEDDSGKRQKKGRWKFFIVPAIFLAVLLGGYLGLAAFFTDHFYFDTEINCISVSGRTVADAEALMEGELKDYVLTLNGRDGVSEQVKAEEIGLQYGTTEELQKFKDRQDPYNWLLSYFDPEDSTAAAGITFDENLLKAKFVKLAIMDPANVIEPKNAAITAAGDIFTIVEEVRGSKVDGEKLFALMSEAILKGETVIDLDAAGCYVEPQYRADSQQVIDACDTLNRYAAAKLTYVFGTEKISPDKATISGWLSVNDNYEVSVNEAAVTAYMNVLAAVHPSDKSIYFKTSTGQSIGISELGYGMQINVAAEVRKTADAIRDGKPATIEPEYFQTEFLKGNNNIGNTYVEINLQTQHLWFYKNGVLVTEGDVVTGNVSWGMPTPRGIYRLYYKAMNVILTGPDYAAPVTYWMPFNGGIGIHDATWRGAFGGEIYVYDGSHGCINSPYWLAEAIYWNIEADTPIIVY